MRPSPVPSLLALATAYGAALIVTRLDVFSIDVAGHLASGMAVRRGAFHPVNDSAFLGYVQNLFYPPLEDLLLGALLWLLPLERVDVFKLFLSLLVAGCFAGVGLLAWRFEHPWVRWLFVLASITLFYAHKAEGWVLLALLAVVAPACEPSPATPIGEARGRATRSPPRMSVDGAIPITSTRSPQTHAIHCPLR
ncbi:hypothetical protein OWM54_01175 [Myxococcus sp. MISCRS1]|uniref:hypothetical protein n=1 Tax=Myxococcus sp. MISCRS1 TaxID=2996786 RepID=UPI00227187C1|nr:hypothetical protein [Myxococcus sp. MISCRS1]MCY0995740.1 hypothetical protein [Myxococcus sp. MISCRS1]